MHLYSRLGMDQKKWSLLASLAGWFLVFLPSESAHATTRFWSGSNGTTNWADATNWSPSGTPTSSDAVVLDNSLVNPIPEINAQSGASAGTLSINGVVNSTFLNYGGATPYVLNLYGATVNAANTGPLLNIESNAPTSFAANKINFQLHTSGQLSVAPGKSFSLFNCFISQSGTQSLTFTGGGTMSFSGSGPQLTFTGGLNIAAGTWIASDNTVCLPTSGTIAFTNPIGTSAAIQSSNSHTIAALSGGNANSSIYVTGSTGLTVNGSAITTFSGIIQDNGTSQTVLTYAGLGSLTLNGANTYSGKTTISTGTLALGATGSIANSLSIAVASGAKWDVSAVSGGYILPNGATLTNAGSVVGPVTLASGATLTGAGTVTGALTAGSGSTINPGSGTMTVTNGFTQNAGAHLAFTVNSATAYGAMVVSGGNLSLAGDMTGTTFGYSPAGGDTFYLVRNNGLGTTTGTLNGVGDGGKVEIAGSFFLVSFTSDYGGKGFQTGGTGNDVAIQRTNDPSPSEVNATISLLSGQTLSQPPAEAQLQITWQNNAANASGFYVYQVLTDGTLDLIQTIPATTTSYSGEISAYTDNTYAVQAFNAAGTLGDPVYAYPATLGSTLSYRQNQVLAYLNSNPPPSLTQTGASPDRIGRTGFWWGEGRLQEGDQTNGLLYITDALGDASDESENAGFSLWPGMDTWFRWGSLLSPALKSQYQTVYTTTPYWGNGATYNEQFMDATASYLANTVWGSAVNSQSSAGYTTANMYGQTDNATKTDVTGKTYIVHEMSKVPFRGFEEDDSNHYLQFTIAPILTLAQFASDAAVKNQAQMIWDYGAAESASCWLNGHPCIASPRGPIETEQSTYDNTPMSWWLAFGGPDSSNIGGADVNVMLAQPSYTGPVPEVMAAATQRTQSYTRMSLAQPPGTGSNLINFKQTWMTPTYALWSQVEGDVTFNADASFVLKDVNANGVASGYQAQRWGLAWDDPTGADSVLTITTPTTYKTATDQGISIYEKTLQYQDTMIAVYNIPATGGDGGNDGNTPNQLLNGHISTAYTAIIDNSATTGRLFLHYNSVLVSLYLTSPFSWSNDFQISPWSKGALAIETAPVSSYPQSTAAARLAAFSNDVLTKGSVNTTYINGTTPRFIYTNRSGHSLDLTYGQAGVIDGDPVDYLQWPMLQDPWMYQPQMGNLFIFGQERTLLYNFYNWTETVYNRPTLTTSAAVAAQSGVPMSVNLQTQASDSLTSASQLGFAVSEPGNGTVQLLSDGHTASFTPNAAFSGATSFDFTVTNRGIHPSLVLDYDFEPPATLSSLVDESQNNRPASAQVAGSGTASLSSNVPSTLGANSTQSLRLNQAGTNGYCLTRAVTQSNLQMSNGGWTFSTWFNRATSGDDDFILYLGSSSGFGGHGDELQLYCAANTNTLRLQHYSAANVNDVSLSASTPVAINTWHHVALVFNRTATNTGYLQLYLDGALAATSGTITWALNQTAPVVFGGHALTSGSTVAEYFNGWLDDLALFRGAFSASQVSSLASQSVATFGGLSATGTVNVSVTSSLPPEITSSLNATDAGSSPFTYQITASNSPTSFNATGLPAGLVVNPSTGLIAGTPTVTGTFLVTLSATNASNSTVTSNLSLTISSPSSTDTPTLPPWGWATLIALLVICADQGLRKQSVLTPGRQTR